MKHILLVEDNRLERRMYARIIHQYFSCQVHIDESSDGESALKLLRYQNYDLVITDLIMPNIEGFELINIIRKNYKNTKVIAVSGSQPFYLYLAKKLGIQGVFTKPLNIEKFILIIEDILALKAYSKFSA